MNGAATAGIPAGPGEEGVEERGPLRRCIVSGESRPKEGLLRFVVGPEATLVPDLEQRLPGRGLWVTADREVLARAVAKRLFSRAARRPVAVPDDLAAIIEAGLARRLVDLIALARRAGQAVAGFEKVRGWIRDGTAVCLMAASDGGADGRARLRAAAPGLPVVEVLTAAELGRAFGRDIAVHGALARGGLASRIIIEAGRLSGLRAPVALLDERAGGAEDAAALEC
jgi:predicted RNA-binding protein YlxR (DUF448 family)